MIGQKKLDDAPAYVKIWQRDSVSQELPKASEEGPVQEIRGPRVESYAVWWWDSSEEIPVVPFEHEPEKKNGSNSNKTEKN